MGTEGRALWSPSERLIADSNLTGFAERLASEHGLGDAGYEELWRWSTEEIEAFWLAIWDFFEVPGATPPSTVLSSRSMPGARWFEGATLNYARVALDRPDDGRPAIVFHREDGAEREMTRRELARAVGAAAEGLRGLGVSAGDRVAAYLPTIPEAVVAFLATASIGAIWSACSPDFGPRAVIDRFGQIEPRVLLAVPGYRYGGRWFDRRDALAEVVAAMPGVTLVLVTDDEDADAGGSSPGAVGWHDLVATPGEPRFEPVAFEHPLWILYSSGTTGLPKSMVHGHGGIVLEHLKSLALHLDLGPGERFMWFTTTGWMMWNFLVSGLLVGATIVLYDGSPAHPDLGALWRLVERSGITYLGTSAPFIHASMRAGVEPRSVANLTTLRAVGSTGAPLSPEGFAWVTEHVGEHVWLGSISGGTDLCTAVVGSCPWLPVRAGEIQCRELGAKVEAFDPAGRPVLDEVGELVITAPMPSMPIRFWGDPDGARYRSSYFDSYPGVWRHGDWLTIRSSGSCVISGRSDATLNRAGIRVGTSEFYRVLDRIPGIADSLVVDTGGPEDEGEIVLFVVLDAPQLDDELRARIVSDLRSQLSPRHAPDRIVEAPGIPMTLNGKRLEVPVKRLLAGEPAERVASPESLQDPEIFRWYAEHAASLRGGSDGRHSS
jgi:acetoacetyl-CoA synthetase